MDSREKILKAAAEVFSEKGRFGTRMDEVAARARINKAMVYYYFRDRDNLHREVLKDILLNLFNHLFSDFNQKESSAGAKDAVTELKKFVRIHVRAYSENAYASKIILETLFTKPDEVVSVMQEIKNDVNMTIPQKFCDMIREGIRTGEFRDVDPTHVLISIVGMNLIYFIGKPIANALLDLGVGDEKRFLKEREENIMELLLYGIIERKAI
jgi:AcrR family transcriptional regulator